MTTAGHRHIRSYHDRHVRSYADSWSSVAGPAIRGLPRGDSGTGVWMARRGEQRAWYWYDWAASAFSVSVVAVFFGPYVTDVAQAAEAAGETITLFGLLSVTATSYYPYMAAIAVALQIVFMPVIGAVADTAVSRRRILGISAYVGAVGLMSMWFIDGTSYQLGGLLFVVTTVAFGCAMTVYNSFLPLIAEPEERDRVSSRAWAMGYAGGVLLLLLNIALFLGRERLGIAQSDAVRWALLSAGAWWAIFTVIPLVRLRNRPPAQPAPGASIVRAFRQLGTTLGSMGAHRQALTFLLAYFFYNDGIQTMIGLSATYAVEELGLTTTTVLTSVVVVQVVGITGALMLARWARRFGATRVVLASLALWVVGVGMVLMLPAGNVSMFLATAAFIGFILGGSQALSRSIFSQLVPRHREGEFFSLFEVSGSASALLGPLVFAVSLQIGNSYRWGLLFLIAFFIIGGVLLARVGSVGGDPGTVTAANRYGTTPPSPRSST